MPQLKHLISSLAMLAMASAQNTSLPTTINADSASTVQTSYTLTATSIAAATGPPPSVSSTTIHIASTGTTPIPTASSTTTSSSTSSPQISIPAIAGIVAGASLLLIALALFLTLTYLKRRRTHSTSSTWLSDTEKLYDPSKLYSTSHPLPRRPSSAATLVDVPSQTYTPSKGSLEYSYVPAQAYTHSKASLEYANPRPAPLLHHSKSLKGTPNHTTNLSRVSEEPALALPSFKLDFAAPPSMALHPASPTTSSIMQANSGALQKLIADKSLPSSPEHEIPLTVLDMGYYSTQGGERDMRPRSSVYSTVTGRVLQDQETWVSKEGREGDTETQGYF